MMTTAARRICLLTAAVIVATAATHAMADGEVNRPGSFSVNVSGGFSSPTGRFGETDTEAVPPKSGHDAGWAGAVDVSFAAAPFLAIGAGVRITSFPIDFGSELEAQFPTDKARTSVLLAELTAKLFMQRGYDRWRPYVVVALGVGRPKSSIDYKTPFAIPTEEGVISVQSFESTVDLTATASGGIGVVVPVSSRIGVTLEPRYTVVSTKGTTRTDKFTTPEGESVEIEDTAKSNTNWWEVRGGVTISL